MSKQRIPAYAPYRMEIFREKQSDGTYVYFDALGEEIETKFETLHDLLWSAVSQIHAMVNLMDPAGCLVDIVSRHSADLIGSALHLIDHKIGNILCELIEKDDWPYRATRVVDVFIEPTMGSQALNP